MKLLGFLGAMLTFLFIAYAMKRHEATMTDLGQIFWGFAVVLAFPPMVVCWFLFLFY